MFGRLTYVSVFAAALAIAQPTLADTRTATEIHGDWDFFIGTIEGVDATSCIASTRSVRTEMFLVLTPITDGDDDTILLFRNPRWDIARRAIDVQLHFDNNRYWTMGARGRGDYVISNWNKRDHYLDMMEDAASSHSATLKTSDGEVLTSFSLSGSRAATNRLFECFKDLTGYDLDQKTGSRDPFGGGGGQTDPF